jgi:hypothetical protein
MAKRVKSAAQASKEAVQRVPGQARQMMDTVKEKASEVGERANNALEGVTKVVATAAGAVVGTVQAAMGSDQQSAGGGSADMDTDDEEDDIDMGNG